MGRHYGCRRPQKAARRRRLLKLGAIRINHQKGCKKKVDWLFSDVALYRLLQNKRIKVKKRQRKAKINFVGLCKRYNGKKRADDDTWNKLGLSLWNLDPEPQLIPITPLEHDAHGGLDLTCPTQIIAGPGAKSDIVCRCNSWRQKCRRNLDSELHEDEQISKDLSKLKESQWLLEEMQKYERDMELIGNQATTLWFYQFKRRLWQGHGFHNTRFKREFMARLHKSVNKGPRNKEDCDQIRAFLEGGGVEYMFSEEKDLEKFLRRLIWTLCREPSSQEYNIGRVQRWNMAEQFGGAPRKKKNKWAHTRQNHFGAGCVELVEWLQKRFAKYLAPNMLVSPREIQERWRSSSFMANHRELAKLHGMEAQLDAHIEVGDSKEYADVEDEEEMPTLRMPSQVGTNLTKEDEKSGKSKKEAKKEAKKRAKTLKVKASNASSATKMVKVSRAKMNQLLKELQEQPDNLMLNYQVVQELHIAWTQKGQFTGKAGSRKGRGKLANHINVLLKKLYKVPCGIDPLHLLCELIPYRQLTPEKSLKKLRLLKTPLTLQTELTILADLLEYYPQDLLLWHLLGAALLDQQCHPKLVFHVFMPRFRAWNDQFFGLNKGKERQSAKFSVFFEISCIWVLLMAYLLDSKVEQLLDVISQRQEREFEDSHRDRGVVSVQIWPKQVQKKLQDRFKFFSELPVREMTQKLLKGLPDRYDKLFGSKPLQIKMKRVMSEDEIEEFLRDEQSQHVKS